MEARAVFFRHLFGSGACGHWLNGQFDGTNLFVSLADWKGESPRVRSIMARDDIGLAAAAMWLMLSGYPS